MQVDPNQIVKVTAECPYCKTMNTIQPNIPLADQQCTNCGESLSQADARRARTNTIAAGLAAGGIAGATLAGPYAPIGAVVGAAIGVWAFRNARKRQGR